MNHREMRARLLAAKGRFVFFPDDVEIDKLVSTRAFTHLVVDEDIVLYAHPVMEEQLESELEESYDVIYDEPVFKGKYFVSPAAKIGNISFEYESGLEILKYVFRKPFEEEIKYLVKLGEIIQRAMSSFFESLSIGITEREAKSLIDSALLKYGADGFCYETCVASGSRTKYPSPYATEKKIKKGEIIYIDACPVYRGYLLQFSRVIFSEERKEWMDAVRRINAMYARLSSLIKPGTEFNFVDRYIRANTDDVPHYTIIPAGGFYQPFAPGAGLFEENMVFTVVPTINVSDGVIRVKRNMVVKKRSSEFFD